jgi:hypothetical protein
MERYIQTGMLKDRVRAGRVGASVAGKMLGIEETVVPTSASSVLVAASIFSAILGGEGTGLGIAMGTLLKPEASRPEQTADDLIP